METVVNWLDIEIDGTILAIPMLILVVIALVVGIIFIVRAQKYLSVRILSGSNDDEAATSVFKELVAEVERDFIIHDDGGDGAPIYDDCGVVEAVRKRLREQGTLTIRCLFNQRGARIESLEKEFPCRFIVHHEQDKRKNSDVHFKIIDGGRKAYLSTHAAGISERRYELIDCTDSTRKIRQQMFGKFYHRVTMDFPE